MGELYEMFSKNGKETAKKHDINFYVKNLINFYKEAISCKNLL